MQRAKNLPSAPLAAIAALALVLGLAACGSSSPSADKTTTTASDSGKTTTTKDDGDSTSTTEDSTETTVVAKGGGAFCKDLATFINSDPFEGIDPSDKAAYAKVLKEQARKSQILLAEAPDAVGADVGLLADAQKKLIAELEKVDYDVTKLPPAALEATQTPEAEAASKKLQEYVKDTCGIDIPQTTAATANSTPATVTTP